MSPSPIDRLIHLAACRAPADLAERLEEEWLADLAARRTLASRLRFALGCVWATRVIAREHRAPAPAPARVASATTAGGTIAFSGGSPGLSSRRTGTFVLVALLHVAALYGLLTGLGGRYNFIVPTRTEVRILEKPRDVEPVNLPKVHPDLSNVPVVVEYPPPVDFTPPPQAPPVVTDEHPQPPTGTAPAAPTHIPARALGGPGTGFPAADDFYPEAAKRLEQQGITTIGVCVGADGRLTGDPTIVRKSGFERLDEGAKVLAKAGSGHYRPTTEDGRAVSSCYDFNVRFKLRN
jgi:periplasmic protein TonB